MYTDALYKYICKPESKNIVNGPSLDIEACVMNDCIDNGRHGHRKLYTSHILLKSTIPTNTLLSSNLTDNKANNTAQNSNSTLSTININSKDLLEEGNFNIIINFNLFLLMCCFFFAS